MAALLSNYIFLTYYAKHDRSTYMYYTQNYASIITSGPVLSRWSRVQVGAERAIDLHQQPTPYHFLAIGFYIV